MGNWRILVVKCCLWVWRTFIVSDLVHMQPVTIWNKYQVMKQPKYVLKAKPIPLCAQGCFKLPEGQARFKPISFGHLFPLFFDGKSHKVAPSNLSSDQFFRPRRVALRRFLCTWFSANANERPTGSSWRFRSVFSSSLRSLLHSLTRLTFCSFQVFVQVCKWVCSDDFHVCECSIVWYRGDPTGFFPSLTGALRSHHVSERSFAGLVCRVQRQLLKRCQLSEPLTCSLPVGTLYNPLLLKFLRRKW